MRDITGMERPQVSNDELRAARNAIALSLHQRLDEKTRGAFISTHEALGVITEEYKELIDAVQSNERNAIFLELIDIATGCEFALASMLACEDA